nr:MAG: putative viral replication protein [Circoviridae sp.]
MQAIRRSPQSQRWTFTVNNWTPIDETIVSSQIFPLCRYAVYGREVAPTTGTPHLQGYCVFLLKKSLASLRDLFPPGTHLEIARESSQVNAAYCKKDKDADDIAEHGSLPNVPGRNNVYHDFRDWILCHGSKPTIEEVAAEFPDIYHKSNKCIEFINLLWPADSNDPGHFRPYQRDLAEYLQGEPDPRKIIFIVDPAGNSGKTWFTEKLLHCRPNDVQILSAGRNEDVALAIDERKSIFFFDLPRCSQEHFQYRIIEQLKNRRVFSTKYQSRMKCLDSIPHVVVLTNEYPDMTKLSKDRYEIKVWNYE